MTIFCEKGFVSKCHFLAVPRQLNRFKCWSVCPSVGYHVEFPCHRVRFGFLHSERLGPLETFDLNEKLGHLHDLNNTHNLNVTSQ